MELNHLQKPKKPVTNVIIRIAVCFAVLLVGIVGMAGLASLKKPPAEIATGERPLKVEVLQIQPADIPVFITGHGEVRALNIVSIAPEISGKIVMIHPRLDVGEIIPKGEVLFRIDARNYSAAEAEARASVSQWENTTLRLKKQYELDKDRLKTLERNRNLAKAEYQRLRNLLAKHNIGTRTGVEAAEQAFNAAGDQADQMAQAVALYPIRIKEAESSLASAMARHALAKANLDRCRVQAPFDGRIKSVSLETGQYVAPGQNVITLADDSLLEVQVPLDSRDVRKWLRFRDENSITDSKPAWFTDVEPVACEIRWTEDNDGHMWFGGLHRVVKFDQQTRTVTVAIRVDSENAAPQGELSLPLVEGMFCSVRIPGRILYQAFLLPRKAVTFENTVYLAVDNRLKTVSVEVAKTDGEYAYVTGGLNPGDTVITTRLIDPLENTLLFLYEPL